MPAPAATLAAKVAYLRSRCGPGDAAIETHFAWLFLAGDRALKLRKPVARDTMDYRTLESRRAGTLEEVRLNRRLAPDVYLAATPLTQDDSGALAIDGHGVVVDWLVVMRRLDRALLLDARASDESFDDARLDAVASLLARFYRDAAPAISDGPQFVARLVRQAGNNHAALAGSGRPEADRLLDQQQRAISRLAPLLARRAAGGCVVEAHGDLRPEHVYLGDPPAVIDCLEFDRDLRLLDCAEELSFLELECRRMGHARAGRRLALQTLALLQDDAPEPLLAFYRSHRGATRAKLYAWRAAEPDGDDAADWFARADGYVAQALRDAEASLAGPLSPA